MAGTNLAAIILGAGTKPAMKHYDTLDRSWQHRSHGSMPDGPSCQLLICLLPVVECRVCLTLNVHTHLNTWFQLLSVCGRVQTITDNQCHIMCHLCWVRWTQQWHMMYIYQTCVYISDNSDEPGMPYWAVCAGMSLNSLLELVSVWIDFLTHSTSPCVWLSLHCTSITGDKPYKCHVCDKAFSESGHLN